MRSTVQQHVLNSFSFDPFFKRRPVLHLRSPPVRIDDEQTDRHRLLCNNVLNILRGSRTGGAPCLLAHLPPGAWSFGVRCIHYVPYSPTETSAERTDMAQYSYLCCLRLNFCGIYILFYIILYKPFSFSNG